MVVNGAQPSAEDGSATLPTSPYPSFSPASSSLCERDDCENRLPLSLQKLLNPTLTSHSSLIGYDSPEPVTSNSGGGTLGDSKDVSDLTQLRPWKRLPTPPSATTLHQKPNLPPLYLCIPTRYPYDLSSFQWSPESPVSPQLTPYEFTLPAKIEDGDGKIKGMRRQRFSFTKGEDYSYQGRGSKSSDGSSTAFILSPIRPDQSSENETNLGARAAGSFAIRHSACHIPASRGRRQSGHKKGSRSHEKERNRCLTCGSSFSTFANLTRHEKKCVSVAPKTLV